MYSAESTKNRLKLSSYQTRRQSIMQRIPNTFQCLYCPKGYDAEARLKRHTARHKEEGFVKCPHCNKLIRKYKLFCHLETMHSDIFAGECDRCYRVFTNKKFHEEHIMECNHKGSYKCIDCGHTKWAFIVWIDLQNHLWYDHSQECNLCGHKIRTEVELWKHVQNCSRKFECYKCKAIFENVNLLASHKALLHPNSRPFNCSSCSKGYAHVNLLNKHVADFHTHEKMYNCPQCKDCYPLEQQLEAHIKDEHEPPKDIECNICVKMFRSKLTMERHVETLHPETLVCEFCDKRYKSIDGKRRHMASHYSDKTYRCKVCDDKFPNKYLFDLHRSTHSKDEQFQCPECDQLFKTKRSLCHHSGTHRKKSEFKCHICDFVTEYASALARHRMCHLDDTQYKCEKCKKSLRTKAYLEKHMELHHEPEKLMCYQRHYATAHQENLRRYYKRHRFWSDYNTLIV